MDPLLPTVAHAALHCPICRCELGRSGRALRCRNRHNFDVAQSGYVNLTLGHRRSGGDTREQLQRRTAVLSSGVFDFIGDAILAHWRHDVKTPVPLLLDAGSGTGYHLHRIAHGLAARIGRPCAGLGIDLSKDAALIASRHHKTLAFAVSDIWSEWPVRDSAVDFLTSIFVPKNFSEMARTLRSSGQVALVYPGPLHLIELRQQFGLMRTASGKGSAYRDQMRRFFADVSHHRIARTVDVTHRDALDLILMGPNARHLTEDNVPTWAGTRSTTFDVELLLAHAKR